MKKPLLKLGIVIVPAVLFFSNTVTAALVSWVGGSGDWNTATNWSTGTLPGINDNVVINPAATITVTHSAGTHIVHSIQTTEAFVLSGGTLTVSSTFIVSKTVTLVGGVLESATVITTNGTSFIVQSGTLNGVTINGVLDVGNSVNEAGLAVVNGLVLNGTALVGNPTNGWHGNIEFSGSQTLSGTGTVVFGNYSDYRWNVLWLGTGGTVLTIGNGITVRGENGTVGSATYPYGGAANVSVINHGTISADVSGGTIVINAQPFTNQGLVENPAGMLNLAGTLSGLGNFQSGAGPFVLSGVLTNTGQTLVLNGATNTLTLQSGTILGGSVNPTNGTSFIVQSGTLNGVTINGVLDVGNSVNGAGLTVVNGLMLNGTALVGNPTNNNYGTISFAGSQTLGGNGTVVFGDYAYYYNALYLANAGTTLTIGSGITVHGQNGTVGAATYLYGGPANVSVINHGTISADVSGGTIAINAQPFSNQGLAQGINGGSLFIDTLQNGIGGTVLINGGSLTLNGSNGSWTNAGTINATNATVSLGGVLTTVGSTLGNLGKFNRSGGTFNLTGSVNNTNLTLVLNAATNTWSLQGGTIMGGTVTTTSGASLVVNGSGTLNGVTVNGVLDVGNSVNGAGLTVVNGLVLNGTALVGNPTNNNYGTISFAGSQTLGGNGTVVFGDYAYYYNALYLANAGTTLTIGSGITVHGQNGTVGAATYLYGGPANVSVINHGTISADVSGGTIAINAQPFSNQGLAQGINGGSLFIDTLQNGIGGTVLINGGSLTLNGSNGSWTNAGTINATNATVSLGGVLTTVGSTLGNLGKFNRSGGTFNLTGSVNNTNLTLVLNAATNTWSLQGGTIMGGTVTTTSGASLVVNGSGTLNGVTVNGVLDVGNSVNGAGLTVVNGLVLNGTALVGNPTNNNYGTISFAGSQTLGGNGTVVFGDYAYYYNALYLANAGTTLTIGSGITVHGQNGTVGAATYLYGGPANVSVINHGTISADVSGGTIAINAQPFSNQGLAQGINGGSLFIDTLQNGIGGTVLINGGSLTLNGSNGSWTNAGTINATNATVSLGGVLTTVGSTLGNLGKFNRSGGTFNLTGSVNNTNLTLVLNAATNTWSLQGGTIMGGTVTTTSGASLVVNGSGTLNGVTVNGVLDVGNSVNGAGLTVVNGLVLNGTALVGNPTNNSYGAISFAGSQTLGGNGTVVFGDYAYYYNALYLANAGTTLTIGSGITVHGQNGTVGAATYLYGGPANVSVINHGTISADVSGGTIAINAQPFSNLGTLSAPIGTINLNGTYNLAGGIINVGISGLSSFGQIYFGGDVSFAGNFGIILNNGYQPALGNSFAVLNYGSENGSFSSYNLPNSGLPLEVNYGNSSFTVTATQQLVPIVNITSPEDNSTYQTPISIPINAVATSISGTITRVDFFRDNLVLGEALTSPYSMTWSNVPPGAYSLVAKATDTTGVVGSSSAKDIIVLPTVQGTNFTWVGSVSSEWFTAGNWNPSGVPGAFDEANIDNGGTVSLSGNATIGFINLASGTINGAGLLSVSNAFYWTGGSISCPVKILTNSRMIMAGSSTLNLLGVLTNAGTVDWAGTANLQVYNNGFSYTGGIVNLAGAVFNVQNDQTIANLYGNEYFNNAGLFQKGPTTGTTTINVTFNNTGTVNIQSGTVAFNGGGAGNGTFTGAGNSSVTGGTLTLNGTAQNLLVSGGTVNGVNASIGNLTWSGGTLEGTNTVTGSANWIGGSIGGGSTLTIASNALLNISGSSTLNLLGVLTNAGTVDWAGTANLQVYNNGFSYTGGIVNLAGAVFNVQNDQTIANLYGNEYFNNAGLFQKGPTTGTTTINVTFNNTGTVNIQSGTVAFNGGGAGNGTFTGAGNSSVTGGTLTLNGTAQNLLVSGGTVNGVNASIGNLTWSGGTLEGTNTVTGSANWIGGSIGGGSTLTIASNALLNISGSSTLNLLGVLTNAGTVDWAGTANLQVYNNGFSYTGGIVNLAGAVFNVQNDQTIANLYGNEYFNNAGLFQKGPTTGTTTINVTFNNTGTVNIQSGTVSLNGAYNLAGGILNFGITSLTNFGSLNLSGSASLSGALGVNINPGYVPTSSNSFALVTYGSRTGTFASLNIPIFLNWQTNYGSTAFTLVAGFPQSAVGWFNLGYTTNGSYTINPSGSNSLTVNCLMTLSGGGWTELSASVANSFLNTNTNSVRDYLYLRNGTSQYFRTPLSTLVWSWTNGSDLYGTYYYSTAGAEQTFVVTPSTEHQLYGVGGSSGGGCTPKCLIYYYDDYDPINAQTEICQNVPEVLGCGCFGPYTVYFRENAPLMTNGAPIIVTQPTDQLVLPGTTVQFYVTASGAVPLSYQWFINQTNWLSGATNTTLILTNVSTASAGLYSVIVSNAFGATTSTQASLTISNIPDLAPVSVALPTSVVSGTSIQVACIITNLGSGSAAGVWYDGIYFSSNAVPNVINATLLAEVYGNHSVTAGSSYGWTNSVILPQVPAGTYYLFVVVDDPIEGDVVYEVTKTDNTSAAKMLQVGSPDLALNGIYAPATGIIAQPVQLVFTITNSGNSEAAGPWLNQVLLAPDTNGIGALTVGTFTFTSNLVAGASTTITQLVILPAGITGTQYFGVFVDSGDAVSELNKTNNTSFGTNAIVISSPDLVLKSLNAPVSAQFGQPFTVQFAVTNAGTVAATASWSDQLYFGLSSNSLSAASVLATLAGTSPLASGNGYIRTQAVTIPLMSSSVPGAYFITAVADSGNAVFESTKINNSKTIPITLTLPPLPDLTVGHVSSPTNALAGQTVPVSWIVTNIGAASATAPWQEAVYLVPANLALSQFITNLTAYPPIGQFTGTNTLIAGAIATLTQAVTIPLSGLAGDLRAVVIVDSQNSVPESNETNNVALALNDLQVAAALSLTLPVTNVVQNTSTPTLTCLLSRNGNLTAAVVVSLTSSAASKLTVPANVTIPAGVSTAQFTATVLDNGVPGPNVLDIVSANASGYLGTTSQVLVLNTDVPGLALSLAMPHITEGQTVMATVTSTTANSQPVVVSITSSSPAALSAPSTVTIPANSNSVAFTLLAVQNSIIAPAQTYTVSASASGNAAAAASLMVFNDNTPTLTLSLDRTNINKADGPLAAVATVGRQPVTDQPVTVTLVSTNAGAGLVPAQVTIPSLTGSATFYVAAVNDTNVSGPEVTLIAAQALDILGNPVGNAATEALTVQDDNGPTLNLTIASKVVPKGANPATTGVVWTTKKSTNDLIMALTSSSTNEATVPLTVTIPAGQTNVTFALASLDDGIPYTSQTVSITASATSYASGSDIVTVTDIGSPDLVIANINAPGAAFTAEPLTIGFRLLNQGLGTLTNSVTQNVYFTTNAVTGNNLLVGAAQFSGTLTTGQFADETVVVPGSALPPPGTYWVVVVADANNNAVELNEADKTLVSREPVVVSPLYTAVVNAGLTNVVMGTPMPLYGSATLTAGGPATNVPVNILLTVRGLQRIIGVYTDANGNFSTVFNPLANEAGSYIISAVSPGINSAPSQDQFNILGMSLSPSSLALGITAGSSISGSVSLQNLSDVPLTGLTATINGLAANLIANATFNTNYLTGQGGLMLSYMVTPSDATVQQSSFTIQLASAEGVVLNLPVNVTVNPLVPQLVASPSQLSISMLEGAQTILQFNVVNVGGAPSGPLTVNVPSVPWLSVASVNPVPSIAPGQSNLVTLVLSPGTNLALGSYTGYLAVDGSGTGVQIPFAFNAVTDAHGALLIQSVDEFTFYGAGAPPLTNANVTLTDPFSGSVVAGGLTDSNGLFFAPGVMAGTYTIAVTANQHTPFTGSAVVTAGMTNTIQAFLPLQTVTYTWTVVPTQIQDQTTITIQTTFETDVPAPVVVPTPASLDLSSLTAPGQFMDVPFTLANNGLIAAQNVTIAISSNPLYQFDIVTTNIGTLPAHGTITVPMRITLLGLAGGSSVNTPFFALKKTAQGGGSLAQPDNHGGPCTITFGTSYSYPCGPYGVSSGINVPVFNALTDCGSTPSSGGGTSVSITGGGCSGCGGGWGSGGTYITHPSISVPNFCDPCVQKRLTAVGLCVISFLPTKGLADCIKNGALCGIGLGGCINTLKEGPGVVGYLECYDDVVGCLKSGFECVGQEFGPLGKIYDIIDCSYSICSACNGLPGHSGLCGLQTSSSRAEHLNQASAQGMTPSTDALNSATSQTDTMVSVLLSQANDVQTMLDPYFYFFGSGVWFQSADTNAIQTLLAQFESDIQTNSDGGQFVTIAEREALLAMPLSAPLAPSDLNTFIDRWNLTLSNYAGGILSVGQLPAGSDTNFIAFDQWTNLIQAAAQIVQTYQNNGYTDPSDAWLATKSAILENVQGGSSGTCAQITLQIDQTAILTENAFHATLQLNNNGTGLLTNVLVDLNVQNQAGQDVTSLFGLQPATLTGSLTAVSGTGSLSPNASGTAQWTLIPGIDAAPQSPANYLVSGTISYVENGLLVTIPLTPQSITVQPSPQLYLTYFLQRDVFGDDPFTPEIEPSVPFPLAVMVQNKGYGTAYNFQITSAQPTIVDNKKGLLIDFNIIGTEVNGQQLSPSLTAMFGDLPPKSISIGEWFFTSSLEGLFTAYSATFQNIDAFGNPQLSPIQGVSIHEITHMVEADGAWDDGQPDFLVINPLDPNSLPNNLYLSDGTIQPVNVVQTGTNSGIVTTGNMQVQFTANFPAGFTYVLVPDPANGQFPLQSVLYGNGTSFLTNNFWITDRTFIGLSQPPLLQTNLHLFVYNTNAGPETYTLVYGAMTNSIQTNPPVSAVFTLPAQSPQTFGVVWSGASYVGGAPIAYYDIYVSDNGSPFTLWQSQTTGTGALYNGTQGHIYAFYSIATDAAGNRESTPLQPQAQTAVSVNTTPPTISVISNVTLNAGQTLSFNVTASDPNPLNTLTFSLGPGAPVGVVMNPSSGQVTWATSPSIGGTTNKIIVIATDNGEPPLSAAGTVTIIILPPVVNSPVLAPIGNYSIFEAQLLTITNSATDNNLPPKPLTFSMEAGAPTNATINPVTGVFQWRPTADQASGTSGAGTNLISWSSTTNAISVIVTDNGNPPLSATQQFTVIVTAVSYEYALSLGSTNVLVGGTSSVPVTLNSSLPLTNITTLVQVPTALLTNLTLLSVSPEIMSTLLQPLGTNLFAISLSLNPALNPGTSRTLAQLGFTAIPQKNSAIAPLMMSQLSALQTDGEIAAKPGVFDGRVFIVGSQPLLDAWLGTNAGRMLTVYGNPGASYQIAYSTNVTGTNWVVESRVPLTNLFESLPANSTLPQVFYRALEFSANPPILELQSSASTNFEMLVFGQKGSNYMIMSATNLSKVNNWKPMTGFTMTNSFQFINMGGTTNPALFFRAEKP